MQRGLKTSASGIDFFVLTLAINQQPVPQLRLGDLHRNTTKNYYMEPRLIAELLDLEALALLSNEPYAPLSEAEQADNGCIG